MNQVLNKREDIEDKFKWDMTDVYKDEDLWEQDRVKAYENIGEIEKYSKNLCDSKEIFKSGMDIIYSTQLMVERVYFYANQKYHENLGNSKYQKMSNQTDELITAFGLATSFVVPAILACSQEKIAGYLVDNELVQYKMYLNDVFRQKKHILSEAEEAMVAKTNKFSQGASNIFSVFNNVDIDFPEINDGNGNMVKLTHGNYNTFLTSKNREVRKDAFMAMYHTFAKYKNTLSMVYQTSLNKDSFYADVRKYDSSREMFLDDSNIDGSVYDNLIKTVNENLPIMHKYLEIRKKALNLDELHMYDIYVPIVDVDNKEIDYDKAKEMVLDGLKVMGTEYTDLLKEGFNNRWIDVYENEGKRSGAYSWSVYDTHPYVLLNYQPQLNSVFTIAHEMGHALHSYYSNKNNSYINSEYKIFVAEVASTCNESLLINHLINKSEDDREKAYLINYFLEQFRTTLFRQTMFAEFENIVHKMSDEGEPLNAEIMCDIYYELNKKYYGENMCIDKEIEMEWARIPHFYTAFYVYQYATGFSAAVALSKKILEEGESAVNDYKKFLKSGCSDYPIELLKIAGVDMSSKEPVEMAMKMFENLVNQFEKLINK